MVIKLIEKKPVFSRKNIILFLAQFFMIIFISWVLIKFIKIPAKSLQVLSVISMISVQASISLLSITIMQLILPDRKERILGVTYQNILFKWKVLKFFNALDCMMYMLLLLIINISLAILSESVCDIDTRNICTICFIFALIETLSLAVYMIFLGLITKFKRSRIYYLLYKRILKGNKQGNDVFNMLLKGMREHSFETYKQDYDYLENEINIIEYMIYFIKEVRLKDINEDIALVIMKKEKEARIKKLNSVNKFEETNILSDSYNGIGNNIVENEISDYAEQLQKRIQKQL